VTFRIEDTGLGMARDQVARLNLALAGAVPDVTESTARHTGFPVVHRIARRHSIGVRFALRRPPGTGTLAMVTLPPQLLCAIPAQNTPHRPAAAERSAPEAIPAQDTPHRPAAADRSAPEATAASAVPDLPRRERTALAEAALALPALPESVLPESVLPEPASLEAITPGPMSPEAISQDAAVSPEAVSAEAESSEPVSAEAVPSEPGSPQVVASEPVSPQVVASETVPSAPASPESVAAEADQDPPPCELPRREPVGLRVDERTPAEAAAPPPQPQPQPQQATARTAFANDLSAFSEGIQEALAARGITGGLVSALFDGPVIKEGVQS
jgi:hypothetical protein